ncbi:hypothetical protein BFP78_10405 [Gaetbulibacter sp. 5U11]|nr:hypothetical protein BFP78_10405 [Gaetbulibacter sp. 5U11]
MKNFTFNKTLLFILALFSLGNSYNVLAQTETTLGFYDFESGTQGWTQSTQAYRANNTFYAYVAYNCNALIKTYKTENKTH